MAMMTPLRRMTAALAVGTMMVIAAPVGAATTSTTGVSLIDYWDSIKTSWWTLAGTTITGVWTDLVTTTYAPTVTQIVSSTYSWVLNITATTAEGIENETTISTLLVGSSVYGPTVSNSTSAVVSASIAAVPAPIAAAGLPAVLGLMGFAAWRRRQGAVAAA